MKQSSSSTSGSVLAGPNRLRPVRARISVALAAGLLIVVVFQLALTLGAPLGAAAMGGVNPGQLPQELRFVSAVGVLFWTFAIFIVLSRGGLAAPRLPRGLARWGTWTLVAYLAVGVLMNAASPSPWERFGWAPFILILFVLTLLLARGGLPVVKPRASKQTSGPTGRAGDS